MSNKLSSQTIVPRMLLSHFWVGSLWPSKSAMWLDPRVATYKRCDYVNLVSADPSWHIAYSINFWVMAKWVSSMLFLDRKAPFWAPCIFTKQSQPPCCPERWLSQFWVGSLWPSKSAMRLDPRGSYLWAMRLCESGERRPELARSLLDYFLNYGQRSK